MSEEQEKVTKIKNYKKTDQQKNNQQFQLIKKHTVQSNIIKNNNNEQLIQTNILNKHFKQTKQKITKQKSVSQTKQYNKPLIFSTKRTKSIKQMINSTQSLTHGSPIKMIYNVGKDGTIDEDSLYERLNLILSTFYTEKEQYEEKVNAEKRMLQEQINAQSELIYELQSKVEQLQHQTRQLRFNYHQRGAVVDYLKKKVIIIEKKFDSEKEQMLSVVKYLQSRNSQLNEIIYQLKNKQSQLNQHIFQIQEKFVNMTNDYCNKQLNNQFTNKHITNDFCNKNITQKPNLKLNTKRTSISQKYDSSASYTPMSIQQIAKYQNSTSFSKQNLSNLFLDDLNNQSLAESSIKEKTIKYQNSINRTRSEDEIDFAQLNHIISLGGTKQQVKNTQIQQVPGKGILINNYGHLTFGDYQPQPRQSGLLTKQKKNYLSRPKLSLPNNVRYPTQLNTRRTNKETLISHDL